ncbi:MAG: glycosyltransferase family 2 protein [Planctomycetota bacterium]|nr:glycosyltransferase family 2 protein [Planctomycetota bacterium]
MNPLEMTFWISVTVIAYVYLAYPLLVWALSRLFPSGDGRRQPFVYRNSDDWPFVSLVISAYREESSILSRLENAILCDYPADRFEIIVGVDGNEDLTGDLVREFNDPRVRLLQFPVRRGKASVLNDVIPQARGEVLILSDANTDMEPSAMRKLVQHFSDSTVGGVCGRLILKDSTTGSNVDGAYWRYENFLKECEGRFGTLLGMNGAIYAIRKPLYQPIPANTIIDDFLIGMRIHLRGQRLIYEESAVAHEETAPSISGEFHRRARIGAGGFQSLPKLARLLNPFRGRIALAFWSHKVLRWFCPVLLLAAMASNLLLDSPLYHGLLALHVGFYFLAASGVVIRPRGAFARLVRLPTMFVSMNAALAVGFVRLIAGRQGGTWKRTVRENESNVGACTVEPHEVAP